MSAVGGEEYALKQRRGGLYALGNKGNVWKERHFVIKDNFMHYYRSKEHPKPDGVIPLEGCAIGLKSSVGESDKDFMFELVSCNRSYVLAAKTMESLQEWMTDLSTAAKLTINDIFDVRATLGCGTFSKVKLGILRGTESSYALKIIDKHTLMENREALLTEISILKQVKHPNVISMLDIFETRRKLYLIMDVLSGGELFDRIVEKGSFSERGASDLSRTIIGAIQYLHKLGIVHRDLKPENLLYMDGTDEAVIKIADFGLSKYVVGNDMLKTACGTPGYVAPEVLMLVGYGKPVDMWAIGVIIYILLCGFPPFYAENDADLFKLIKQASFEFPSPYWDGISSSAKDLVSSLLRKDPRKRLTAEEALLHPWVTGETASTKENTQLVSTLKEFNAKRKFQKGVGKIIAVSRMGK